MPFIFLLELKLLKVVILITNGKNQVIIFGCGGDAEASLFLTLYQLVFSVEPFARFGARLEYHGGADKDI
jgi:hypothetical protein